jgi:hypothetical protein
MKDIQSLSILPGIVLSHNYFTTFFAIKKKRLVKIHIVTQGEIERSTSCPAGVGSREALLCNLT